MGLLIKFLERLYRTLPHFCSMATSTEFIEALAATLFPPHDVLTPAVSSGGGKGPGEREGETNGSDMIEFDDEEVKYCLHQKLLSSVFLPSLPAVCGSGQQRVRGNDGQTETAGVKRRSPENTGCGCLQCGPAPPNHCR